MVNYVLSIWLGIWIRFDLGLICIIYCYIIVSTCTVYQGHIEIKFTK